MDEKRLPDTPWHVGFVKKEEDDPRRHKARCIYYAEGVCHQGKMGCFLRKCPGSSHCKYYAESESMAEDVYLKTRSIEEERADQMQETLFQGKAEIKHELQPQENTKQPEETTQQSCERFSGIESIRFKEIVFTENYKQWKPDPYELEKLMKYYEEHKKLDKPVLVKIKNGRYKLKDNFLQYYVAKKLHKTWVKATMDAKYLNGKSK